MASPESLAAATDLPVQIPACSLNAKLFLASLDVADYSYLLFPDQLITTSDSGSEVGEFSVKIEATKFRDQECFMVHASSEGNVNNVACGTSITTYVSTKLETLEQQHHEYVKLEELPLDRKTHLVKQSDGYVVNKVTIQGTEETRLTRNFSLAVMEGFMSEGSNLLLQRLLIKKHLPDDFQLVSLDADTNLCPAVYTALPERHMTVAGEDLTVSGIERTIDSVTDLPTTWQSYFTSDGYLASRVQVGSPVIMRLLNLPEPINKEGEPEKPEFEKKPLTWEDDLQMYSKYMDRKAELKSDHALYMRRHPELRALVADFLQFLLLRKPDDVITFASSYFSSFSAHIPDTSPYMTTDE